MSRSKPRPALVPLLVAALAFAAGGGARAQPTDLRVHRVTPDGQSFSDVLDGVKAPFFSPDGRWIAFWFDGDVDETFDLYVASRFGGAARRVSATRPSGGDPEVVNVALFTPDSRRIVFRIDQETAGQQEIWSVPVDGVAGDAVKLSGTLPAGTEASWFGIAPDSERVAFTTHAAGGDGLWSAPVDGSATPVQLHPASGLDTDGISAKIAGDRVVFLYSALTGVDQVWSVPVDGSLAPVRVSGNLAAGEVREFTVADDASRIVYRADARFAGVEELWSVPIAGPPAQAVRLSPDLPAFGDVRTGHQIDLAAGRVLFRADSAVDEQLELWSAPLAGPASQAVHLNGSLVANGDVLSFSSDGERVIYLADDLIDTVEEAYVVPIAGPFSAAQRLHGVLPAGRAVGFAALVPRPPGEPLALLIGNLRDVGKVELFLQTLDASDPPYSLFGALPAGTGYAPGCGGGGTPDVASLVVCADLDAAGEVRVERLDLDFGTTPEQLSSSGAGANADATRVVVSPDGRTTVYRADESVDERFDLWRVPTDGSAAPVRVHAAPPSAAHDVDPTVISFAPDGGGILYAADHAVDEELDLWIADSMIFGAGFETGNRAEWSSSTP